MISFPLTATNIKSLLGAGVLLSQVCCYNICYGGGGAAGGGNLPTVNSIVAIADPISTNSTNLDYKCGDSAATTQPAQWMLTFNNGMSSPAVLG